MLGEPGIGKSRLVDVAFEQVGKRGGPGNAGWRQVICQCSPYHTNSALYPVIRQLERAAGFATGDAASVKLDKLERMLGETDESEKAMALLAELLSLPTDRYAAVDPPSVQRKAATIAALIDMIKRLAAHSPLLR